LVLFDKEINDSSSVHICLRSSMVTDSWASS